MRLVKGTKQKFVWHLQTEIATYDLQLGSVLTGLYILKKKCCFKEELHKLLRFKGKLK